MKQIIKLLCCSSLCLLFGCVQQNQQLEANKQVIKDLIQAFDQHDAARTASYFAENAVVVDYGVPKPDTGRAQIQEGFQMYLNAFPDLQATVEGLVAEGDMTVLRWHDAGTHTGPLMGMAATNRRVEVHGTSVYHVVNGKIEHEWRYWDQASFMRQLGMMPGPAATPAKTKK